MKKGLIKKKLQKGQIENINLITGNQILDVDSSIKVVCRKASDTIGQRRKISEDLNLNRDLENPEIELIDKTPTKLFEPVQNYEQEES